MSLASLKNDIMCCSYALHNVNFNKRDIIISPHMPSCGNLCERRTSVFSYAISGCAAAILSVLASLTDTAVPPEQTIKNVVIAFVFWNSYFRGIF